VALSAFSVVIRIFARRFVRLLISELFHLVVQVFNLLQISLFAAQ